MHIEVGRMGLLKKSVNDSRLSPTPFRPKGSFVYFTAVKSSFINIGCSICN